MTKRFLRDTNGATAIEYGLIAAMISLAIFGGVSIAGNSLVDLWTDNSTGIQAGLTARQ